jgi:rRNA-processing protein FCF1
VDAANVVGSVPDGWWRDRPGAAARLVSRLRTAGLPYDVVVVLEGAARAGVEEGDADGVRVLHAPGSGDDALVEVARAAEGPVRLVSADRELGERARAEGAEVVGPGWLREQLP